MHKKYIMDTSKDRLEVLRNRYRLATMDKNEVGAISHGSAVSARHHTQRDALIIKLIRQLVEQIPGDKVTLTEDGFQALDKLLTPIERHRNIAEQKMEGEDD